MIFKRNGLTVLFSILTITSCGGGSSSSDKKIEELNNIDNPVEEVLQKDNAIDESNAIELFRKHLGAVINNPLPIFDVAQIVINGDFSNEQNIPCNVSGVLTKEIIFQRQPHNSFLTFEDDEIQYSFQECSNIESETINGKLSLRYDLYLNDNDATYSSIDSNNYKIALNFDSIEDTASFNSSVNGDLEYNRYKEPGIDETSVYSDYTFNNIWGYKELKKVTYKFTIIENLAQRHESISGEVYLDENPNSATFITNEVLVRDVERFGYYSEGSIKLVYGETSAKLEFFSDDTANINIYSETENTLIYSLINIPQGDIFTRF